MKTDTQIVKLGSHLIGGDQFTLIAGPCSIESEAQLRSIGQSVKKSGAHILRGGIFKMRTKPTAFQGVGFDGLPYINAIKLELNLPLISEVVDPRHIEKMLPVVDAFQVGSRNMYNYELLKELALTDKPVMLKRGFSATLDEWLHAADYLVSGNNQNIILCERGIRTFETKMRNTLDLNSVVYLKKYGPYPVIVDPSHGTGKSELVSDMAFAAAACGADGIMIEVHDRPSEALSDGFQALTPEQFDHVAKVTQNISQIVRNK